MHECQDDTEETLLHALVTCHGNDGVGHQLLAGLRNILPELQGDAMLRLELPVEEDIEFPVTFLLSTVLQTVWSLRQLTGRVRQYQVRSQLEAEINLLRETRFKDSVSKIEELAETMIL